METMSTQTTRELVTNGFATKFVVFVNVCDEDCYSLDITKENALAMIDKAEKHGNTINAFYNETTGTLAIG